MKYSALLAALLGIAIAGQAEAEEYLLYTPHVSQAPAKPVEPEEGVLVKNITIQWGDTLYKLSRKYSGVGSYFPQILLFNKIDNPDLIYAGKQLKVPVTKEEGAQAAPSKAASKQKAKKGTRPAKRKGKPAVKETKPAAPRPKPALEPVVPAREPERAQPERQTPEPEVKVRRPAPTPEPPVARPTPTTQPAPQGTPPTPEQELFESGMRSYKSGDYRKAVEQFDRLLQRYPDSLLAADATLYRADSYMKMSNQ